MQKGSLFVLLLTAAVASLLTSCASSHFSSTQSGSPPTTGTKTTPVIDWPQPSPTTTTTPLSAAQLNATANVPGTFTYSPAAGATLPAGTQKLSVNFTPDDTADYKTATASVSIVVMSPASAACTSGPSTRGAEFVYVSTAASNTGPYQIQGFVPASDGSLTTVPGSPFTMPGVNYLTGANSILIGTDSYMLYSYTVHADGCLSLKNSAVVGQGDPGNPSAAVERLFLNPDNTNLYTFDYDEAQEGFFASYKYNGNTGSVAPTGETAMNMMNNAGTIAFNSSGEYAITSDCSNSGYGITEFQRGSDGALSTISVIPVATAAANGNNFCPWGAAADHSNHFVVAMSPCTPEEPCTPVGNWQLAVYSMDDAGKMTTASTPQNMPAASALYTTMAPEAYEFSPDDRYFAIVNFTGFDVFAWDSGKAVLTHIAAINNSQGSCTSSGCTGNGFGNLAWDTRDHLYTWIGNQLYVYAVSDSGVTQAPGSPYAVQNQPWWVTVVRSSSN